MVMILSSALVVVSFTVLWADLDRANAFQPGRAFLARKQQQLQHQLQQQQRQHQHSTPTTLWATTANATTADPDTTTDWVADSFHPAVKSAIRKNVVVGPSHMLIYDTSLRGK